MFKPKKKAPMTPNTRQQLSTAILNQQGSLVKRIAKNRAIPFSAYKEAEHQVSNSITAGKILNQEEPIARTLFSELPKTTQASIALGLKKVEPLNGGKHKQTHQTKRKQKKVTIPPLAAEIAINVVEAAVGGAKKTRRRRRKYTRKH